MKLRIITHSGNDYVTEVENYDPIQLNEQINNRELMTVVIGNQIISRIDIKNISPIVEEEIT